MKRYAIVMVAVLATLVTRAQDKIYFRDGKTVQGKIMSIGENTISYKDSTNAVAIKTVPKRDVIIAEYKNGSIFIFGDGNAASQQSSIDMNETRQQRKERKMREWKDYESKLSDNILGFYLPEIFFGRLTVSYERLLFNKTVGIKVPASLTYNLIGAANAATDTAGTHNYKRGVNFITGLDLNFYTDLKPGLKYMVGPRFRVGTDMLLDGLSGYTAQIQNGIFRSKGERFIQSFSIGFGFFQPSQTGLGYTARQVYPWGSINWRLGFRL